MKKPVIEVENYSFLIGSKPILDNISLKVLEGEYLSIIGPNGAGKTTLLKCLVRILTAGKGSIRINGKTLDSFSQKDLARLIGYVPQAGLADSVPFTVKEFVMMGRYPHLSPFTSIKKSDQEIVNAALELTGTVEFAGRFMNTLSGGERQKVLIAAALTQEAGILLLDEPTTFLDPHHRFDIHKRLKRINREWGVTILAVTHDINNAALMSDKILALKKGSVVFYGQAAELMKNEVLKPVFDEQFLFVSHPQNSLPVIVEEEIRL